MYKGDDRRKYKRVKAEVQVDIEKYEPGPMLLSTNDGALKNLSLGGVLVNLEKPLELKSLILTRFSLPHDEKEMEIVARVVRCEKAGDNYEIGLEFIDAMPLETKDIQRYVESESGRFKKMS